MSADLDALLFTLDGREYHRVRCVVCNGVERDVFKQAKCDDACMELADLTGWGEELRTMVKREHQRIDGQQKTSATETTRRRTVGTKHVAVGKGGRKPAAGQ